MLPFQKVMKTYPCGHTYCLRFHLKIIPFVTLDFFPVVPSFTCSDVGTETGLVASCQCFLRRNSGDDLAGENSHKFVKSTTNQVRTGLLQLKMKIFANFLLIGIILFF